MINSVSVYVIYTFRDVFCAVLLNARRNETKNSNNYSAAEATSAIRLRRMQFGLDECNSAKAQNSAAATKFGGSGVWLTLKISVLTLCIRLQATVILFAICRQHWLVFLQRQTQAYSTTRVTSSFFTSFSVEEPTSLRR